MDETPMKISDLVALLERLKAKHGDVVMLRVSHTGHLMPMFAHKVVMTTRGNENALLVE